MILCKRDKDVAVRVIKDFERINEYEAEIRKFDKVLKDKNANVQTRAYAKERIGLAEEHRNRLKENLKQW